MPHKTIRKPNLKTKVYSVTFDAFSLEEFEAKKVETVEELQSKGMTGDKLQKSIDELNGESIPQKTLKAEIQEPQFKELALGMSAMMTISGTMDLATSGKIIFDTCCVEYDAELDSNPRVMMSLCIELAKDYVLPMAVDIKKK
jgi:hypothetical protein